MTTQNKLVHNRLEYHTMSDDQRLNAARVRKAAIEFTKVVQNHCPRNCRELGKAEEYIEEALMWATKGIALQGTPVEEEVMKEYDGLPVRKVTLGQADVLCTDAYWVNAAMFHLNRKDFPNTCIGQLDGIIYVLSKHDYAKRYPHANTKVTK